MSCDAPNGYCDWYEISSFFQQPSLHHRNFVTIQKLGWVLTSWMSRTIDRMSFTKKEKNHSILVKKNNFGNNKVGLESEKTKWLDRPPQGYDISFICWHSFPFFSFDSKTVPALYRSNNYSVSVGWVWDGKYPTRRVAPSWL